MASESEKKFDEISRRLGVVQEVIIMLSRWHTNWAKSWKGAKEGGGKGRQQPEEGRYYWRGAQGLQLGRSDKRFFRIESWKIIIIFGVFLDNTLKLVGFLCTTSWSQVVGENMKALEVAEGKALEREEKFKEQVQYFF